MSAKRFLRACLVCILAAYTAACDYNPPKSEPETYQYPNGTNTPRKTQQSAQASKPRVTRQRVGARPRPRPAVTVAPGPEKPVPVVTQKPEDAAPVKPSAAANQSASMPKTAQADLKLPPAKKATVANTKPAAGSKKLDSGVTLQPAKPVAKKNDAQQGLKVASSSVNAGAKKAAEVLPARRAPDSNVVPKIAPKIVPKPKIAPKIASKTDTKKLVPKQVAVNTKKVAVNTKKVVVNTKKVAVNKRRTLDLEDLPLNITDLWVLDVSGEQCMLSSRGLRIPDGQGGTPLTVVISKSNIAVLTRSNIDTSYAEAGVKIGSKHIALEKIENDTNLVFVEQRDKLLSSMVRGSRLELVLGFWPSWPKTQTYRTAVSLAQFSSALEAWKNCNDLINKNNG